MHSRVGIVLSDAEGAILNLLSGLTISFVMLSREDWQFTQVG
jgi:hypothetical protein